MRRRWPIALAGGGENGERGGSWRWERTLMAKLPKRLLNWPLAETATAFIEA